MHFDLFRQIVANSWESYIDETWTAQKTGKIMVTRATLVYPTLLLFVETADHFLAEAYGATEKPQSLAKVVHKISMSSAEYLFQFAVDDMVKAKTISKIQFGGKDQPVRGLYFMRSDDQNAFITRFPFIDKWGAGVVCKGGFGPAVYFADTFRSGFFANCLFLNQHAGIYRAKFCSHLIVVEKKIAKTKLLKGLQKELTIGKGPEPQIVGIQVCGGENLKRLLLGGQFANMFLVPGIRETTIGKFLEKNSDVMKAVFQAKKIIPQAKLPWIEGNPDPNEVSIQPDFLLQRQDGFYDICDIKTIVDKRNNVTRGGHKRRRFIDYVNEGLAQLANYEEYFSFPKNAEAAKDKYDVQVQNPKLILIVGSYENAEPSEVKEACRKLKDNIEILDYDTLNMIFMHAPPE